VEPPTYQLTELSLEDMELLGLSFLHLFGSSFTTLTSLELYSVDNIPLSTFETVFKSLIVLDRLLISTEEEANLLLTYPPRVLSPLTNLTYFNLRTDSFFPEEVLETVLALPSIETVQVNFPSISYRVADSALAKASSTLRDLKLETWDDEEEL